jgi:transposase-like protein
MKIICKKCGDDKSVRNGYSKRKNGEKVQKYRCNKCNGYFILNPSIKRMDAEDKKRLEDMINEGIGKRKIQRLLGYKSVTTVLNYLKKK